MKLPKLVVVTASIDPGRTKDYWQSWKAQAKYPDVLETVMVVNGPGAHGGPGGGPVDWLLYSPTIMGPVPAFAWGVEHALARGADFIACLHDDLRIDDWGWDAKVHQHFETFQSCGLLGFGGAKKLGRRGMYTEPYDPMSLARHEFVSNMQDAEAHGIRLPVTTQVAVLDGFSMVGRRGFFEKAWAWLRRSKIRHHAYDAAMGALAARAGVGVWMLPVKCHHHGGMTAVGSAAYQDWARKQIEGGDQGFWEEAHRIVWEEFRDVLPLGW